MAAAISTTTSQNDLRRNRPTFWGSASEITGGGGGGGGDVAGVGGVGGGGGGGGTGGGGGGGGTDGGGGTGGSGGGGKSVTPTPYSRHREPESARLRCLGARQFFAGPIPVSRLFTVAISPYRLSWGFRGDFGNELRDHSHVELHRDFRRITAAVPMAHLERCSGNVSHLTIRSVADADQGSVERPAARRQRVAAVLERTATEGRLLRHGECGGFVAVDGPVTIGTVEVGVVVDGTTAGCVPKLADHLMPERCTMPAGPVTPRWRIAGVSRSLGRSLGASSSHAALRQPRASGTMVR